MKKIQYLFAKVRSKIFKNNEIINDYFRKQGITLGEKCKIYSNILSSEPYLITIGDNVTFSNDVQLINHDNSICKIHPDKTDVFGKIKIGNNCFIGARVTILYGVELADDVIVAAGSVVTRSFNESRIIIGGNPAKKIGDWDTFAEKVSYNALNIEGLSSLEKKNMIFDDRILIKK
ncbi:acyltransferase [Exiguobacterium sp. s151]|uniref:acyltransferase n=1 Tax=Exiguobacterium sp. s151 TaxID=2751229 RepID=UPI001BE56781|nr:acyltransferase [Exiguobacterium sp. s151]